MVAVQRILVATDFSEYSGEAVRYAADLGKVFKADLFLVHVFEPAYVGPGDAFMSALPEEVYSWVKELKEQETRKLDAAVQSLRKELPNVKGLFKTGHPFVEIIRAAEEIPADMIVLGTHGRTGLAHVLLGSVAERVVRKASCPVLTVRPKVIAGSLRAAS